MRAIVKWLGFTTLVCSLAFVWGAQRGHDDLVAQQRVPTVTRMFTGADGLSHLAEVDMPVGEPIKVAAVQFNHSSASNRNPQGLAFHTAPHRRYVVTLSGAGEIVVSGDNNKKFIADRDHILLAEDTTGKGHTTRAIGPEDWVRLFVEIDQPRQSTR